MRVNQRVRLCLAIQDMACAFGCWVIAFAVALTPLVFTVLLVYLAVQRWG